jgi:hypothetical protein
VARGLRAGKRKYLAIKQAKPRFCLRPDQSDSLRPLKAPQPARPGQNFSLFNLRGAFPAWTFEKSRN